MTEPEIIKVTPRMTVELAAAIARTARHRQRVILGVDERGHTFSSYLGSVIVAGLGTTRPTK